MRKSTTLKSVSGERVKEYDKKGKPRRTWNHDSPNCKYTSFARWNVCTSASVQGYASNDAVLLVELRMRCLGWMHRTPLRLLLPNPPCLCDLLHQITGIIQHIHHDRRIQCPPCAILITHFNRSPNNRHCLASKTYG